MMGGSTPKRALLEMESHLKGNGNTPVFDGKFDRFCRSCGMKIEKAALRKFVGQKCNQCSAPVEGRKEELRLWDPCVECDSCLMCFMKFCSMCGVENVHYDVNKPARFEAIMRSKIRSEVKAETTEDWKLMAAAQEAEEQESQKSKGASQNPKGQAQKQEEKTQKAEEKAQKAEEKTQKAEENAQKAEEKAQKVEEKTQKEGEKAQKAEEKAQKVEVKAQKEGEKAQKSEEQDQKPEEKAHKPEGGPQIPVGINTDNDPDKMDTDD